MAKCPRAGTKFVRSDTGQLVTVVAVRHGRTRARTCDEKAGFLGVPVVYVASEQGTMMVPQSMLVPAKQVTVAPPTHLLPRQHETVPNFFLQPFAPGVNGIDETDTLRLYGSCVKKCRRHAPQSLGPCIDKCQESGGGLSGTEGVPVRWEVFDEYGNSILKGRERNRDTAEINAGVALRRLAARNRKRADQYSIRVGGGLSGTDDYHAHSASMWATNAVEEAELGAGDALHKGQCNRALESLVRAERKTTMASTNAAQTGNPRLKAKALASNTLVNALWREFQTKCIRRYPGDHPGSVLPFGGLGAWQPALPTLERKPEDYYDPSIRITYEVVTPESAEQGDVSDRGWIDEEGVSMAPEDEMSTVDRAVKFLRDEGATEPSSSAFHPGIWYSWPDAQQDSRTGEHTTQSYHLHQFTPEQQRAVYNGVVRRGGLGETRYTLPDVE